MLYFCPNNDVIGENACKSVLNPYNPLLFITLLVVVAYSRTTRLVLSATLSVYGRRIPATPVVLSVAVNLRALTTKGE